MLMERVIAGWKCVYTTLGWRKYQASTLPLIHTWESMEKGERAPYDTIVVIIDPSVKTIKQLAFWECEKMRKYIMHGRVHTIECCSFFSCTSLEAIFLPSSL